MIDSLSLTDLRGKWLTISEEEEDQDEVK